MNPSTGTGANFGSGTVILQGFLVPQNFAGSFSVNLPAGNTGAFNSSGLGTAISDTTNSITGGGGTSLTVQVLGTPNPSFFVNNPGQLTFTTTNSQGFTSVAPLSGFWNGSASLVPNINWGLGATPPGGFDTGTTNGVNGNSLMFQSIATSSFNAIPEPSSLVLGATAALGIPMFLSIRRRYSKNPVA